MKYYYSTVHDVVLTMHKSSDGRHVGVRFERANEHGFDFAEGLLPECTFQKTSGFTEDELFELADYLRCNAMLIWEYSQKGGGSVA